MTTNNPAPIKVPVHLALELRVRAILIHEAFAPLDDLVGPAEGEPAACLRLAREHALFISEAIRDCGLDLAVDGEVQ
jgi:hypothetical protein